MQNKIIGGKYNYLRNEKIVTPRLNFMQWISNTRYQSNRNFSILSLIVDEFVPLPYPAFFSHRLLHGLFLGIVFEPNYHIKQFIEFKRFLENLKTLDRLEWRRQQYPDGNSQGYLLALSFSKVTLGQQNLRDFQYYLVNEHHHVASLTYSLGRVDKVPGQPEE